MNYTLLLLVFLLAILLMGSREGFVDFGLSGFQNSKIWGVRNVGFLNSPQGNPGTILNGSSPRTGNTFSARIFKVVVSKFTPKGSNHTKPKSHQSGQSNPAWPTCISPNFEKLWLRIWFRLERVVFESVSLPVVTSVDNFQSMPRKPKNTCDEIRKIFRAADAQIRLLTLSVVVGGFVVCRLSDNAPYWFLR